MVVGDERGSRTDAQSRRAADFLEIGQRVREKMKNYFTDTEINPMCRLDEENALETRDKNTTNKKIDTH